MEKPTTPTAPVRTEFQVLLRIVPEPVPNSDQELEQIAELAVEALRNEAAGLALGPVASVNLDQRLVELEMTIEAATASELHQKMGLILGALERGTPLVVLQASTTSRSTESDDDRDHELVCA